MIRRDRLACRLWWIVLAAAAVGCQVKEPARPSARMDACADRLHDLCGHLLLYYSAHGKLPPSLEDLNSTGRFRPPPAVCPVSGKAYVYNPEGLEIPDRQGRLVVYDPEPSHAGMRWGILVDASADAASITARVIMVTEQDVAGAR